MRFMIPKFNLFWSSVYYVYILFVTFTFSFLHISLISFPFLLLILFISLYLRNILDVYTSLVAYTHNVKLKIKCTEKTVLRRKKNKNILYLHCCLVSGTRWMEQTNERNNKRTRSRNSEKEEEEEN